MKWQARYIHSAFAFLVTTGVVVVALGLGLPARASAQDQPAISVQDNLFQPSQVQVTAGETVTWSQDGAMQHTITADDGSFDSAIINPGDTFSFTFDAPGTYQYYCQIHGGPGGEGMSGVVVVD
jgi:plastocyanin